MRMLRRRTQMSFLWPIPVVPKMDHTGALSDFAPFGFPFTISRWILKGLVALKKQCGRARINFAIGWRHNPPFPNPLPLVFP